MVKIVNGVIVSDSEAASLMNGSDSSFNSSQSSFFAPSGGSDLTVNICSYKFNKWMIVGVVFIMTLVMGFKGLLLSCLVFFAAYLTSGPTPGTAGGMSTGGGGGGGGGSSRSGPRIVGVKDLPKPVSRG